MAKNKNIIKVPKVQSKVTGIQVTCSCSEIVIVNNVDDLSGSENLCELCGSHGSVTIYFTSPKCKNVERITIKEW